MKIRNTGQDLQTVIADLKQHVWDSSAMPPKQPEPEVVTILKGLIMEGQRQSNKRKRKAVK
jgi:hypothetical protein